MQEQLERLEMADREVQLKERQRIISELVPLHKTIQSNGTRLSSMISSCHHAEHLHSSVSGGVDVMKRITAKAQSTLSRAQHGDATSSDVSMVLELVSQSCKIIDSAAVHIGKRWSHLTIVILLTLAMNLQTKPSNLSHRSA